MCAEAFLELYIVRLNMGNVYIPKIYWFVFRVLLNIDKFLCVVHHLGFLFVIVMYCSHCNYTGTKLKLPI